VLPLFAAAIFLAAALLFLVEPLAGKIYLPLLGGSPSVWNTCVVFFQGVLLLGYLYAHLTTRYLRPRPQAILHVLLLAGAALTLPIPINVGDPGGHAPVLWLVAKLTLTMGLPFFVISATGPLLQRWFSRTSHGAARDPYFLYAASNAGSLVGLLAYPLLLEPLLTRQDQSLTWSSAYGALGATIFACAWMAHLPTRAAAPDPRSAIPGPPSDPTSRIPHPTWARRLRWIVLALVPSSLMLGVTQHISTDLAAVPLLWIIPLLLYLLSFVVAFSARVRVSARFWGRLFAIALIILVMIMLSRAPGPLGVLLPVHLLTFFLAATMCHRMLAEDRPDPAHLTDFYFCISLGGVVGGCFNALLAPLMFRSILEYPLMLGAACLLRPQLGELLAGGGLRRLLNDHLIQVVASMTAALLLLSLLMATDQGARSGRLTDNAFVQWLLNLEAAKGRLSPGLVVVAVRAGVPAVILASLLPLRGSLRFALAALGLLIGSQWIGSEGLVLLRERSFFGVATIYTNAAGEWHALYHGTTQHGIQFRPSPAEQPTGRSVVMSKMATTYYALNGPVGDIITLLSAQHRFNDAAFIGLGAGTLAAYGRPGTRMTFFEIDPAIAAIAEDPACFSFIADAKAGGADIDVVVADGRLGVAATRRGPFDLIVIDAFSSDAIPIHLITREAVAVYLGKLKEGGVIAFHISNRSFRLAPVLARLAQDQGLHAYRRRDVLDIASQAKRESDWVALTRTPLDVGKLPNANEWKQVEPGPTDPLWTDDYSNILSVLGASP
jgi:hypothetical protein